MARDAPSPPNEPDARCQFAGLVGTEPAGQHALDADEADFDGQVRQVR